MQLNSRVLAMPRTLSLRSLGWLAVALMLAVALVPWAGARPALSANPDSISVAAPTDVTVAPAHRFLQSSHRGPPATVQP